MWIQNEDPDPKGDPDPAEIWIQAYEIADTGMQMYVYRYLI